MSVVDQPAGPPSPVGAECFCPVDLSRRRLFFNRAAVPRFPGKLEVPPLSIRKHSLS
jgi:hypothetical protein